MILNGGRTDSGGRIDRASGLGGACMAQILPLADGRSLPLFNEFESAVYHSMR